MAKPMKILELHYPMVQFLISINVNRGSLCLYAIDTIDLIRWRY